MFQHVCRWSRHAGLLLKAGTTQNVEALRETKGEATWHTLQCLCGPNSRGEPQKLPSLLQTGKGKARQGKAKRQEERVSDSILCIFHKQSL